MSRSDAAASAVRSRSSRGVQLNVYLLCQARAAGRSPGSPSFMRVKGSNATSFVPSRTAAKRTFRHRSTLSSKARAYRGA